jgi:cytochrome c556
MHADTDAVRTFGATATTFGADVRATASALSADTGAAVAEALGQVGARFAAAVGATTAALAQAVGRVASDLSTTGTASTSAAHQYDAAEQRASGQIASVAV